MTTTADAITTLQFYPKRSAVRRYFALWYFTILLIVWNIIGHAFLGFEQSHIQPLVGLATAIGLQFLLEWIDARASGRKLRFAGSWADLINFLPPAIIPGLAVTMLLYPNERLMPVIFGVGVAICSKVIFRALWVTAKHSTSSTRQTLGLSPRCFYSPRSEWHPRITSRRT